jgi:hypothetical protein
VRSPGENVLQATRLTRVIRSRRTDDPDISLTPVPSILELLSAEYPVIVNQSHPKILFQGKASHQEQLRDGSWPECFRTLRI